MELSHLTFFISQSFEKSVSITISLAFNFAESSGVGTPGIKQPDGKNEASKSLDRATFSIGETKDQKIAP